MEKCGLCSKKIEETFLDKKKGTLVKVKDGDKNKRFYVCSDCQKKFKDKLKEELSKK